MILTPKMVENIFEIICIFTAAKNHISNFVDTPFDPDYCIPSRIFPRRVRFKNVFMLKSQIQQVKFVLLGKTYSKMEYPGKNFTHPQGVINCQEDGDKQN